jgi:hypothetical protein
VSLGVSVFSGMVGVTLFGLFFTPVFYVVVRWLMSEPRRPAPAPAAGGDGQMGVAVVKSAAVPEPAAETAIQSGSPRPE